MIYNKNENREICKQNIRVSIGKIEKQRKKPRYRCMEQGCNEFAIGSHSQQMGGQLKTLSEDGKVISIKRSLYDLYNGDFDRHPTLEPIEISNASVFPGYCNKHDTKVFECIERNELKRYNFEQAATLFLRAISHEVAQKRTYFDANKKLLKMCSRYFDPNYLRLLNDMQLGREKLLSSDGKFYLEQASESVTAHELISTVWIKIDHVLPISICTVFSPIRNQNERMQDWMFGAPQKMCSLNIVPTPLGTHVVFSWLKVHDIYCDWLRNLENDMNLLEEVVNEIAICDSEDICFKPSYWNQIDAFTQEEIKLAFVHEAARGKISKVPRAVKI